METPTLASTRPSAPTAQAGSAGPMTWADVCADPSLHDLPYKIEQDRYGRLLMSPASSRHSRLQGRIERLLEAHLGGEAFPECAITTTEGVRVPDVVWMSDAFAGGLDPDALTLSRAPEICVEVMSPSNVWGEMAEKIEIFLNAGAHEVWVCTSDGRMRFFGPDGEQDQSALASDFPLHVPLPGRPS